MSVQPPERRSEPTPSPTPVTTTVFLPVTSTAEPPTKAGLFDEPGVLVLTVSFQPKLPLADMKARLVLNRLSTKVRVLSTDPPVERLDETDSLASFTIFLTTECNPDELRGLADVEGVTEIRIEPFPTPVQPCPHTIWHLPLRSSPTSCLKHR